MNINKTLKAASVFAECGPNYRRNVADLYHAVMRMQQRGFTEHSATLRMVVNQLNVLITNQ